MPKIALIPLYVSWFGLFSLSKVMLVFTDCLFPIVIFTYHGARGLSPIYLWSAQARGTRRFRMLWRVVLPLSLASIYDGVQVAVVVALLVAVVSEMVSGGGGLGTMMIRAYRYGDVRTAFAALLTISLIGYALYRVAQSVRFRLLFWHSSET
jgi:ABC-type nitrate/sulfonate/bicarbonate transport system permease component